MCPVCREPLNTGLQDVPFTPAKSDNLADVTLNDDIREMQQRMAALYEKQKAKGGIIDVEAEKNKYYLTLVSPIRCKQTIRTSVQDF